MNMEKRQICTRCDRPTPWGCICEGIPEKRIALHYTRVFVLQHPSESRRKNRSLPLLELSLRETDLTVLTNLRRLGDQVEKEVMTTLQDERQPLLLLYPGDGDMTLQESLDVVRHKFPTSPKINLLVLDATWKYAREMDMANAKHNQYPPHMIRVALSKDDFPATFTPRRFDIRAPPSVDHLSTAESIAYVLTKIERKKHIYDVLMIPLDAMVKKWHSFSNHVKSDSNSDQEKPQNDMCKKAGSKKRRHVQVHRV
jgi:DTW domain-containing protein YfiP